jgi:hypothetical protein
MKLKIKHKNTKVKIVNDFKYDSYVDVKSFIKETIETTIEKINQNEKI